MEPNKTLSLMIGALLFIHPVFGMDDKDDALRRKTSKTLPLKRKSSKSSPRDSSSSNSLGSSGQSSSPSKEPPKRIRTLSLPPPRTIEDKEERGRSRSSSKEKLNRGRRISRSPQRFQELSTPGRMPTTSQEYQESPREGAISVNMR